jgi:TPP-dependent pyruvate/acetoin dehydrogenase alpha subunit
MIPPSGPASLDPLSESAAASIHRTMVRIRVFETRVEELFTEGRLPGFVHTYVGEEAIASSICEILGPDDYITSTHRGHGHGIAKGMGTDALMAELFGKETGANKGRGGSMHVADFSLGMLGANGIVGGGFGLAVGAGISAVHRGAGQVVVCFFGDGALNKGSFHESLNYAAVSSLPVLFVCENNQYASRTPIELTTAGKDVADRAIGYGMAGRTVDGNDVGAVFEAAGDAIAGCRQGTGPVLLNCVTYRHGGHYVGDAQQYRTTEEVDEWRAADPITRLELALTEAGWIDTTAIEAVWASARAEVEAAEQFAESSPDPEPATALHYVYTGDPYTGDDS